jgi:RNA polymerase sigma-70 factor, ECF subfamily
MKTPPSGADALLQRFSGGDPEAADELIALLYKDLRRMASYYLRQERRDHTLQPTALVHEAYLRLANQKHVRWQSRTQFFAIASQLMRRILVDYARRHNAVKRGAAAKVPFEEAFLLSKEAPQQMLALDEMMGRLATIDAQQAQIVELRVFGGLTVEEVANLLNISPATIKRDWSVARAWLSREISRSANRGAREVESN